MRRNVAWIAVAPMLVGACAINFKDYPAGLGDGGGAASTSSTSTSSTSTSSTSTSSTSTSSTSTSSSSGSTCGTAPAGMPCDGGTCPSPAMSCSATGCSDWATWKMPNPADAGLPNPAQYDPTTYPGVVVDEVTNLWWQRAVDGPNTQSKVCYDGSKTVCTQPDAVDYCAHLTLAGHCDWRVPTRIELVSIVDYSRQNPALDVAFGNTPLTGYWTSSYAPAATTPDASPTPSHAWFVYFANGKTKLDVVTGSGNVRCVRSGG